MLGTIDLIIDVSVGGTILSPKWPGMGLIMHKPVWICKSLFEVGYLKKCTLHGNERIFPFLWKTNNCHHEKVNNGFLPQQVIKSSRKYKKILQFIFWWQKELWIGGIMVAENHMLFDDGVHSGPS